MQPWKSARRLTMAHRDGERNELLAFDRRRHIKGDDFCLGQLPKRCFVAISQAEAALTNTSDSTRPISARTRFGSE